MLSQTKEQSQTIINKIQVLDFVIQTLNTNHTDYKDRVEEYFKRASSHKLKLIDELLNLQNAKPITELSVVKPSDPGN
jgi:hypothetical protein